MQRLMQLVVVASLALPTFAGAQTQTVNIWPGVAPGSESWTQKDKDENTPVGTVIMNVVTPTITAYLPERARRRAPA